MPENSYIVFEHIGELQKVKSLTKREHLVQGVLNAIAAGDLKVDDMLPSVNEMVEGAGYARETVAKAYKDLIERGIIVAKFRKGYFVISGNTKKTQRIALVMYAYDAFQEVLYHSFMAHVGNDVQVDLFFHHNNPEMFEAIFQRINGNYSLYIVAPIINDATNKLLKQLPQAKLLIIDRYVNLGKGQSYVVQEFEEASYWVFQQLEDLFSKYKEVIFFFRENTAEPVEIRRSFERFIKESGIKGRVEPKFRPGTLAAGKVYFSIHNPELYAILKEAMQKGFQPGRDLGVLAHNNDVVKEVIAGGITTFSVDFAEIGRLAADFALNRDPMQITLPTLLHPRKSL